MNEPKIPATEIDELAETWKQFATSIDDDSAKHAFKSCACDLNRLAHSYRITEMGGEKPIGKGILWKLSPEERGALREVCDYARAHAVDCVPPEVFDCVKLKITQLLGEEE